MGVGVLSHHPGHPKSNSEIILNITLLRNALTLYGFQSLIFLPTYFAQIATTNENSDYACFLHPQSKAHLPQLSPSSLFAVHHVLDQVALYGIGSPDLPRSLNILIQTVLF